MHTFIVPIVLKPGGVVRTMIHRAVEGGGTHPHDMGDITNHTDATFGAGSVVRCELDLDGMWFVSVRDTREPVAVVGIADDTGEFTTE